MPLAMETSLINFRDRFRDLALASLWRRWTTLGIAGQQAGADDRIIDPEALLLTTTTFARHDPRLFDEVLDWLNTNGQFINLQRLQNLSECLGQRSVLEGMAAHLAKRTVHSKWRTLLGSGSDATRSEPLFPGVPVVGAPDELFARRGWLRAPVELRQLSQAPDPHRSSNLLIKLRCLFGMQARAEVMAYLLSFDSGHPGEMAGRLGYFPRTLLTTLNDMARSGHVWARREGHEKRFWLRQEDWRFLITWPAQPGRTASEFPRWADYALTYTACEMVWHFLNRPELHDASEAVQCIELRSCLQRMDPALLRTHIHIPPGAAGATFLNAALEELCRLLE